ncbi:het-domain-containing protein [Fusarium pseudoanthophilum]|uniref:Het-domain-containing protein n=1 Tax=Fusarium pseudoanthophilum TaxID=48495 RepID=A0A8H5Q6Q7_9HYPO|nr:het-domain-containing protein [Fusarium pseudoanthophilum]
MSTKAQIQYQIALLGLEKERLESETKAADDYTQHITQKKLEQQAIVYGSHNEVTKEAAQKEYDYYCGILVDLLDKAAERLARMQELRDKERELSMQLRSDPSTRLQGQLFEYPLAQGMQKMHLYEALSYTWGTSQNKKSIFIDDRELLITANCHSALVQLRDSFIERVLWVDAICIDQSNTNERGKQVRIMAEVYCKARQVIVWLGEAASDSDVAMQKISEVAEGHVIPAKQDNTIPESIASLLKRPWFRRVWVLQEVAAAQHVLLVCGASQIDGYAFCLGLSPYMDVCEGFEFVSSVEYLIRGSIFRPKYNKTDSGLITLGIRSLGELVDMYHAHEATEPLDKVFALLGMSTDRLSASELRPNYSISWDVLFHRLVTFLLGPKISVKTSNSNRAAVISGQGTVIGIVTSVASRSNRNRDFQVTMQFMQSYQSFWSSNVWNLHAGVKRTRKGDFLCLLEGASNPMLVRQERNCFSVIMISASPTPRETKPLQTSTLHKFVLIWNLEDSPKTAQDSQIRTWLDTATLEYVEPHIEKVVQNSHLLVVSAHILVGAGQFKAAIALLQEADEGYKHHLTTDNTYRIECLTAIALAYGSLERWHEAQPIWESIIRACYVSSDLLTQTTDFLDQLLPILQQDRKDYDRNKWQAFRDAIDTKQFQTLLQEYRISDLVEYLDSQVMNIFIDQQDHWPVTMEQAQTAATRNENSREAAMKVFFDRLRDAEIPEQVLNAAASYLSCCQKEMGMLVGQQGQDTRMTQALFRSAAAEIRNQRTLMFSLLGHLGFQVCSEIDTNGVSATVSSLRLGSEPSNAQMDVLRLAKLYLKTDNTTLLRMLISVTEPLDLSHLRREMYLFAWDEHKFRPLDELVQILPPALEDVIATLTHILLSNGKHAAQKVINLARRLRLSTTKTDMVNEEVVSGCSRIIESQSPAELLQFLDFLYELGISFSYQGEVESPPTQSAILPATVSKDPRFLKILIEKKVVSPPWALISRSIPFIVFNPIHFANPTLPCAMMESPSDIVLSTPGYYGPGSITAWYCIVAATAVSWIWNPANRFQPTSDFMAAILYPFIAMIHFAIQLWNFPSDKTQYLRANLMHILIGNGDEGPVSARYDYQYKNQVLFDKPGPDMLEIFPRVVTIDAALRINDNCFWLCLIALGFLLVEHRKNWTDQQLKGFNRVEKCLVAGVSLPIMNGIFLLLVCGDSRTFWIPLESTLFRFMASSL